jgi:hypothetical protein
MRRTRGEEQRPILEEVLARVRLRAPDGVVVLDLDATVMDNRPRQARILADYGRATGILELASARPEHFEGWSLTQALRNAGLSGVAVRNHAAPFHRFWRTRFFTSGYCRLDLPLPGAPEFARDVVLDGGKIAYVTGRPADMAVGTIEAFRRGGLPIPDGRRVFLLMKPSEDMGDDAWKAAAIGEVELLGPVVAAFDNEPAHVNAYARAWREALCVHLETDHSARPIEVLARVPSIVDFRRSTERAAGDVLVI